MAYSRPQPSVAISGAAVQRSAVFFLLSRRTFLPAFTIDAVGVLGLGQGVDRAAYIVVIAPCNAGLNPIE